MDYTPKFVLDDDLNVDNFRCLSVDDDGFNRASADLRNKSFSLLCYNIRSCRRNFAPFLSFITSLMFQFSLIILCETWLTVDIDYGFDIINYGCVNSYRNSNGGGIKIFFLKNYDVHFIDNLTFINDTCEVLSITISLMRVRYLINAIYRPPGSSIVNFIQMLIDYILNNLAPTDKIIIIGDLNINLFNPYKIASVENFINTMLTFSFSPVINIPTKVNLNNNITRYSLIDHIWTNFRLSDDHLSGIFNYFITDHFPIFYIFRNSFSIPFQQIKFRKFDDECVVNFVDVINGTSFDDVYCLDDCDAAFNLFYDKILKAYNECFSYKEKESKV